MVQDTTDSVFAAICIICCLIGLPCNLIALRFFIRKTRDIPTIIYLAIAATDLATSILVLPVGECCVEYVTAGNCHEKCEQANIKLSQTNLSAVPEQLSTNYFQASQ